MVVVIILGMVIAFSSGFAVCIVWSKAKEKKQNIDPYQEYSLLEYHKKPDIMHEEHKFAFGEKPNEALSVGV